MECTKQVVADSLPSPPRHITLASDVKQMRHALLLIDTDWYTSDEAFQDSLRELITWLLQGGQRVHLLFHPDQPKSVPRLPSTVKLGSWSKATNPGYFHLTIFATKQSPPSLADLRKADYYIAHHRVIWVKDASELSEHKPSILNMAGLTRAL